MGDRLPPAGYAAPPGPPRRLVRGLLISVALNAIVPLLLYRLTRRYVGGSEVTALSMAALFPIAVSAAALLRGRTLDPVALLALTSIAVSMIAVALGGSAKLLLIRESLFTGGFGLACFVSLALRRPLMFYFGRYFMAGRDPEAVARFDAGWQRPYFRFVNRTITAVWGAALTADFLVRVALVYALPAAAVLVVSPVVSGGIVIGTIVWTFAYARHASQRARRETPVGST
jgi:hypothetical protein